MDLLWTALMFCLGIGLLVKGADWLVDAAARIAKQFGISSFIIGLTIVALGTSLPELATAVMASLYRNSGIVLGDIVGSNIANLALIIGLAGLFVPIALKKDIYNRDGTILLFATLLFYVFCLDGVLTAVEGGIFLILFFAYFGYFIATKQRYKRELHFKSYLRQYADLKEREKFDGVPEITKSVKGMLHDHLLQKAVSISKDFSRLLSRAKASIERTKRKIASRKAALLYFSKQLTTIFIGIACISFGANFVVTSAMQLPISQLVIGLVFIAIGTSLPELAVTISSLRKSLPQIMIGTLIGSNISNILWVGGISALINPVIVPVSVIGIDFIFLILITWLFLVFLRNDQKITRIESITMLLLYIAFIAMAFGVRLGI